MRRNNIKIAESDEIIILYIRHLCIHVRIKTTNEHHHIL